MEDDTIVPFKKGHKWGFKDVNGNVAIAAQYIEVKDFAESYAAVQTYLGWGYIDNEGNAPFDKLFSKAFQYHQPDNELSYLKYYHQLTEYLRLLDNSRQRNGTVFYKELMKISQVVDVSGSICIRKDTKAEFSKVCELIREMFNSPVTLYHGNRISRMILSSDRPYVGIETGGTNLLVINIENGDIVWKLNPERANAAGVEFMKGANKLLCLTLDNARIIEIRSKSVDQSININGCLGGVQSVSKNGDKVVSSFRVPGNDTVAVCLIDFTNGTVLAKNIGRNEHLPSLGGSNRINSISYFPDGKQFFIAERNGLLTISDVNFNAVSQIRIAMHPDLNLRAWALSDEMILSAADGEISIYDVAMGSKLQTLREYSRDDTNYFTLSNSRRYFVHMSQQTTWIYDFDNEEVVFDKFVCLPLHCAITDDGDVLITASKSGVLIWMLEYLR